MDGKQTLINALPTTGEIEYDALRNALLSQGDSGREALVHFHGMRRNGDIAVRTEKTDDGLKLYVGRKAS